MTDSTELMVSPSERLPGFYCDMLCGHLAAIDAKEGVK